MIAKSLALLTLSSFAAPAFSAGMMEVAFSPDAHIQAPPTIVCQPVERNYLLERAGDIGFIQLYNDGFEKLPPAQRVLAYHLSQAALAGHDIAMDQSHRRAVEIKDVLE